MVLGERERSLLQNQVCSRDGASLLRQVPSGSPSTSGKKKCPLGPDSPQREKWSLDGGEGAPRGVPEASMREGESESARCRTARLPQAPTPTGVDPAWGQLRQVCIESL